MHFEDVEEKISKREIYQRLSMYLRGDYSKGHKGKICEKIQNCDVGKTIDNARTLKNGIVQRAEAYLRILKI